MNKLLIGTLIKKRRQELNMTQSELASGICTQSQISKIEKNEIVPLANLLIDIAKKLDISLDLLINNEISNSSNAITNVNRNQISKLLKQRDYKEIRNLLKFTDITKLYFEDQIYIEYIELIVECYLDKKNILNKMVALLENNKEVIDKELKLNFYNSLGIFAMENKQYKKSLIYFEKAIFLIFLEKTEGDLPYKILYNYSRLLYELKEYKKLYDISREAISYSFHNSNMISLAEFYYFNIYALNKLGWNDMVDIEDYNFAYRLAKMKKNIDLMLKFEEIKPKN